MSVAPFDLTGPLPRGVTVLEASAGTGKTYTIAGLVTRYVAAGLRLPELLVVTFTRAATAELRERVRTRLVAAADHLEAHLAGTVPVTDDPVLAGLTAGATADVRERHHRLAVALAEFDAATIATIHGFCQHVLGGIGLAGDVDRAPTLLEDPTELVEAVVDDLLVRRFSRDDPGGRRGAQAPLSDPGGRGEAQAPLSEDVAVSRRDALAIAEAVVANPDATIVPATSEDPAVAVRVALASEIRREVDRRKRATAQLSYDDLLTRLADALRHPEHGDGARRRLQAKYRVALIDEFQDTDPIQWDIVSEAFGRGDRALVLIGDPKQAIYAFRGADVHAYLGAARRAGSLATLDVNWRSDGPLLRAFNALFDGAQLGHEEIEYRPVRPAPAHEAGRLAGAPVDVPLQVRLVRRDGPVGQTDAGNLQAPSARPHIARDLAAELVALLDSDATIADRRADGTVREERAVTPPDVAVLVRSNAEATLVQRTLRDAGVPAVINGVGSVFATVAAADWLRLLEALERPSARSRVRAAALTAFVGWTAEEVAAADDDAWDALHERVHGWAAVLRDHSVAALWRTISREQELPGRLLAVAGGERALTDLDHVGELLHAAAIAEGLGATALSGWLLERIAEATEDLNPEERARRLESDAEAVQVLTIHRSKGLEFPIVYAPYLWSSSGAQIPVPVCHTEDGRIVDVAGSGPAHAEHTDDAKAEDRGESLRLLYVALTRARHQVVVWWAPVGFGGDAPLSRVLFCRSRSGRVLNAARFRLSGSDDDLEGRLDGLLEHADGTIGVARTRHVDALPRWSGADAEVAPLSARRFTRPLDRTWRRTSYSALTAAAHAAEPLVGSEADEPVTDDEAVAEVGEAPVPAADASAGTPGGGRRVPLADLPGGTEVGTFVHDVFEHVDFAADDLDGVLHEAVRVHAERRGVDVGDPEVVVEGLRRAIETPLGPLLDDRSLRQIHRTDRLDELAFELPLAAGPVPRQAAGPVPRQAAGPVPRQAAGRGARDGVVAVTAIGDLLRRHLPADDPLAAYAQRLADPSFTVPVRGFLTGSLDLVVRLRDGDDVRYAVADYKTNRLGTPGADLLDSDYGPAGLVAGMERGHYPLQALLYVVALHRYLRWRQPGYDPDRHLAGALYLFVRGMTGPDVRRDGPHPYGVFAWRPSTALVTDLSDLLDRGRRIAA